jgi:hypothetical protein
VSIEGLRVHAVSAVGEVRNASAMTRKILGVDPGKTTGYVLLNTHPFRLEEWGQLQPDRVAKEMDRLVELASLVAVERFVIRPMNAQTAQYDALYVIGGLTFLTRLAGVPLRLQTPADAKNVFSDDILRTMDLFTAVSGPHARDALRHGLLAARTVYAVI